MKTSASIGKLCEIKDVTRADARRIKDIWRAVKYDELIALFPDRRSEVLDLGRSTWRAFLRQEIDSILRCSGVEHLGFHKRANRHVYYCNGGDCYATTVIFTGDHLRVGCIGDLIEANLIKSVQDC